MISEFVELHARSAFSFLRGASCPEQLARQAAVLGMPALALCDRDGVYGAPRLFATAKEHGLRAIVGAELSMLDGSVLPVLVENRTGYQNLCRLITQAKLRGSKTDAPVMWEDLPEFAEGLVCLTGDEEGALRQSLERGDLDGAETGVRRLRAIFGAGNVYVEIQRHLERGEQWVNSLLVQLAASERLPLLASNGVLYAERGQRATLDVLTCIRNHTHLDVAGELLSRNSERGLKPARHMRRLFADLPEALSNTVYLGDRLQFSMENLGYEFPRYPVPQGETMDSFLRKVTLAGARARYTHLGAPALAQLNRELALIEKLGFAGYFLIVWDIANFCTEHDILMQGRGSAANSAVCYSLGITSCDPISNHLLFERFLSEGRKGWPDIDLDLPSGSRRESVIQELYRRYGRHGAAMTANIITFRGKSALREIGKALNFPPDVLNRFSSLYASGDFPHTLDLQTHLQSAGMPLEHPRAAAFLSLYPQLYGLPRHLGQHSGGMIICQGMLDSMVPLERASMPGRVVAQWDKDDCEDLGIIKVDLLGLGMMSVLQESLELCRSQGRPVEMAAISRDDPAVFELMQRAETIGVFQIESRAQMATLPRMRPKTFYDVVIEVAIIRPGPIQGDLVHPYLNRRAGCEPVDYIHPLLEPVLKRTLGVPLFQEQILKVAMVIADFRGDEAEELRRALGFHRSDERMRKVILKLRAAMERKGIGPEAIEKVIKGVASFALYGFPESHAISFANLVWTSAWLKVHRTAEFFTGLLNNQPMGFYSPATLLRDGKRHGLRFKPVSVLHSQWKCTIEEEGCIRLGFCLVRGLSTGRGKRIAAQRAEQPFVSLHDFRTRTQLAKDELRVLAKIGALNGLAEHRRDALWQVEEAVDPGDLFSWVNRNTKEPASMDQPLAPMSPGERTEADYHGTGLTVGPHPMQLVRADFPHLWRAADLPEARNGDWVAIAGNVICRQRPGTAKGFVFVSVEDETGIANAVIAPALFEKLRLLITQENFLVITGRLQNADKVIHIRASSVERLGETLLHGSGSHDFH
jgi:error-prone DNA polymerase